MRFLNSWRSPSKQIDKWGIELRLGPVTVIEARYDHSDKSYRVLILGFGIASDNKKELLKG
jgi:hypothetical protein